MPNLLICARQCTVTRPYWHRQIATSWASGMDWLQAVSASANLRAVADLQSGVIRNHARLHLQHLWHAISALRGSAGSVSHLHRGAAVRPGLGPVLDHA